MAKNHLKVINQVKYKGKSKKLGGGGRFAEGVKELMAKGKTEEQARGIMAKAGRAKYGKRNMARWAAAGRKRK